MTTSVFWSGFPGPQQRVPGALCWVLVRSHGAAPLKEPVLSLHPNPGSRESEVTNSAWQGRYSLLKSGAAHQQTQAKIFQQKMPTQQLFQGQVSLVNSNDQTFFGPSPLACLLAIPSVPALYSISCFPAIKLEPGCATLSRGSQGLIPAQRADISHHYCSCYYFDRNTLSEEPMNSMLSIQVPSVILFITLNPEFQYKQQGKGSSQKYHSIPHQTC